MQDLKNISCEKLLQLLPEECIDALAEKALSKMMIYGFTDISYLCTPRFFSTKENAEKKAGKNMVFPIFIGKKKKQDVIFSSCEKLEAFATKKEVINRWRYLIAIYNPGYTGSPPKGFNYRMYLQEDGEYKCRD